MKKFLTFALCILTVFAFVLTGECEVRNIDCSIENGTYVVRIPVSDSDQAWTGMIDSESTTVLKLAESSVENGLFVLKYVSLSDGTGTVSAMHYSAQHVCDEYLTWVLQVQNGKIQECTGGSYTASPAKEELVPVLTGEWLEKDTQFTLMTISENDDDAFDVEIISPVTHGAYIIHAAMSYDCFEDAFIYTDGLVYDVPITDTDEAVLGEPVATGSRGIIRFEETEEGPVSLVWTRDETPDEAVVFIRKDIDG
ncbi:MAG: hypothetical protein IJ242_15225 [Clostridia bacterium]|nr:hypothetical protein [Clostridia bacterium]